MNERPDLRLAEGGPGLVVLNLAKSYKRRPVLRDVSLKLRRGEVAALLGPNGAGKTTCFYAIAGLVPPDRGTITVDGRDVTFLPMYRRAKLGIGYLPQEASVFRGLTVADNIRAILEAAGSGMDAIVKTTVYLADIADWPAVNEVYAREVPEPFPARSAFAVRDLPKGARVEIEAVAAVDRG